MEMAMIYKRMASFFFHASCKTTCGLWVCAPPFISLPVDASAEKKAEAVIAALNGSSEGVPHPREFAGLVAPLLSCANVKSWATFAQKAECCSVERTAAGITIIPHTNLGPKRGFEPNPDRSVHLGPAPSAEDLVEAVDQALEFRGHETR